MEQLYHRHCEMIMDISTIMAPKWRVITIPNRFFLCEREVSVWSGMVDGDCIALGDY